MKRLIIFLFLLLLFFLLLLLISPVAAAEKISVSATGFAYQNERDTLSIAQDEAQKQALRNAVEQIGVRVSSYSTVVNQMLQEDELEISAAAVLAVKDKKFKPVIEGNRIKVICTMVVIVDTKDLEGWEPPDLEKRRQAERERDAAKQEVEDIKRSSIMRGIGSAGGAAAEIVTKTLYKTKALLHAGRTQEADEVLSSVIAGGISHAELYYQRGWIAISLRSYRAAVEDFSMAFELSGDVRCLKGKGDALYLCGDYALAVQNYNRVLRRYPQDPATIANRGAAFWSLGNGHLALRDYDEASRLGLEKAQRIRYTLHGQYEPGTLRIRPIARKTLPLC